MALSRDQRAQFADQGFLKAGRVLSGEQVAGLRDALDAVMAERTESRPEAMRNLLGRSDQVVVQVVNIWEADARFETHLYHPRICEMVSELMEAPQVRVWHDQIQYKVPERGGPTNWHQDHPKWPILQPADLVSAWVALDDATLENGCMRMVPGSHRWGAYKMGDIELDADFQPTPDRSLLPPEARVEAVACEVACGEVMFHHCLTWHGSPPNRSSRPRRAIAVHYMPGWTRYVPTGTHLVHHRVEVLPGEVLAGEYFPLVWDRGPVRAPQRASAGP